jgi:hypothetical protein
MSHARPGSDAAFDAFNTGGMAWSRMISIPGQCCAHSNRRIMLLTIEDCTERTMGADTVWTMDGALLRDRLIELGVFSLRLLTKPDAVAMELIREGDGGYLGFCCLIRGEYCFSQSSLAAPAWAL